MTLKVVQFPTQGPEVNQFAIDFLEEALALAKAGDMTDIALVFRSRDEGITSCYDGRNRFALLGGVEYLAHRIKNLIGES